MYKKSIKKSKLLCNIEVIYTQNKSIQIGLALVMRLVNSCNCLMQFSVQYHRWKEPPNGFKLSRKEMKFHFQQVKAGKESKMIFKNVRLVFLRNSDTTESV